MPKAIKSIIGTICLKQQQHSLESHLEHGQLMAQQSQQLQYDTNKRNDYSPKSSASDSGISSGTPSPASILSQSTGQSSNQTITVNNIAIPPTSLINKEPNRHIDMVKNALAAIKQQQEQIPGIQHRSVIVESFKSKTITDHLSLKLAVNQPETVSSSADGNDKTLITSSSIIKADFNSAKNYPTHYKKHFGQRFNASSSQKSEQMEKSLESTIDNINTSSNNASSLVSNDNNQKTASSGNVNGNTIQAAAAAAAAAAATARNFLYVNGMTPLFSPGHFDMYAYATHHALR